MADTTSKSLPKALCIVEGADDEPRLLKRMSAVCGLDLEMEIVPVRSNIHQLYQILAEGDFQLDIRKALAALPTIPAEQRARLSVTQFAYTYLMYDAELHHRYPGEEQLPLSDIVRGNLAKLEKMCAYFTDETDPTVGRLYVNYLRQSTSSATFASQQTHITSASRFGVLNTTVLLPMDYFGHSYYLYRQQHQST